MALPKQVVLIVAAGLCVVAGVTLPWLQYVGQPAEEATTLPVAVSSPQPSISAAPVAESTGSLPEAQPDPLETPTSPIEQPGDAVEQAEPPGVAGPGMILVFKRPIEVLAGPSSSAPTMYGFPAGRPFRLMGRESGFAQIEDLKSGARGWIDEAALAPPPRMPAASMSSEPKPTIRNQQAPKPSADPKPKATKKDTETTTAEQGSVQTPKPRGLFGLRRDGGDGGLPGFLGGVFGTR